MDLQSFYTLYKQANNVIIDSRTIGEKDIFFAFSGDNFNAATLADDAISKGALAVVVEQKEFENEDRNIFYVPCTLEFLQQLAIYHRSQLNIPIIGLTGSNGKTTTKELIHAVLEQKYDVQYTKGNLNNHIGVPLTILSIKDHHEMAVVEMGANHQKEIELLCSISQPTVGYITNFGKAHLEGFGGYEGVIKGKSELYDYLKSADRTVLVNTTDAIQVEKTSGYPHTITFGDASHAEYHYKELFVNNLVGVAFENTKMMSNLTGAYNFTNLCAAVSLGLHFGVEVDKIKNAVEGYVPTNMRSQITKKGERTVVLDTYNANPSSMTESLKNFSRFEGTKAIVIGDMLELGEESLAEHKAILELAESLKFDKIITVGQHFKNVQKENNSFLSTQELIQYLENNPLKFDNILLKGSRGIKLEGSYDFI